MLILIILSYEVSVSLVVPSPSKMTFGEGLFLSPVTVTNTLLALFAYIVLRFLSQIVYYRFYHPLSAFPGPFWGSVTRLWIAWHNVRETELATVYALTKKYGMGSSELQDISMRSLTYKPQDLSYA